MNQEIDQTTVVFDLGGVLIDWNPRHLYRKLFGNDELSMERFLAEVCTKEWNECQDAGRSWATAVSLLSAQYPAHAALIDAYHARWEEMLVGPISGTVQILRELKDRGTPLYALSNWSKETFPFAQRQFAFLEWFDGIVISGEEELIKPDPRIFEVLLRRFGLRASSTVFIDDSRPNVDAALAMGIGGIHYSGADQLRKDLQGWA